ncbi:MAG: hypothetical protein ACR2J3_10655 [Aridibacter sp.]
MKKIFNAFVFLSLILPSLSFAQQTTNTKESLRGLRGIFVNVLPVAKDAETDGLSANQLQKIVESELRKAKVPILTESKSGEEYANLVIVVDTIKHPQGVYLFTVNVSVVQNVQISRPQGKGIFPAEIYSKRFLGLTTPNRLDIINEPLKEKVGEFIKDYLAANSKR